MEKRGSHFTWVVGHLKPGVTPTAAAADLNTVAVSLRVLSNLAKPSFLKSHDGLPPEQEAAEVTSLLERTSWLLVRSTRSDENCADDKPENSRRTFSLHGRPNHRKF